MDSQFVAVSPGIRGNVFLYYTSKVRFSCRKTVNFSCSCAQVACQMWATRLGPHDLVDEAERVIRHHSESLEPWSKLLDSQNDEIPDDTAAKAQCYTAVGDHKLWKGTGLWARGCGHG